uniref:Uncharacterized protein n=1 Tax=Anguilla anguilla TaxID=7936 RepID=A0A0E9Y1D3_ANGAN
MKDVSRRVRSSVQTRQLTTVNCFRSINLQ